MTGLAGRGGCAPGKVTGVVAGLRELGCRVDGLMTVAPPGDASMATEAFDRLARLGEDLGLRELSMGMSADLEQPSPLARRWFASGLPCSVLARNVAGCNNRVLGGGLAMASFVQRALMYLGLKDIDDEEDYDGDDEEVPEAAGEPGAAELLSRTCAAADNGRHGAADRARRRREPQTMVPRGAVVRPFVTQRHSKPQVVAPAASRTHRRSATWSKRARR